MKIVYRVLVFVCATAVSGIASGQSGKAVALLPSFHVEGTIDDQVNVALPQAEVHFVGDHADRRVTADDKGFYQTDLPIGTYKMTVVSPLWGPNHIHLFEDDSRFFRVSSPTTIKLNFTMFSIYFCDGVWGGEDAEGMYKDACGGEDSIALPSNNGVPLFLAIRYVRRERGEKQVSYSSNTAVKRPVRVAYNLFALQADSVEYSRTDGTLRAYGHVVFEDQSGEASASSAAFKFDDGKATQIW